MKLHVSLSRETQVFIGLTLVYIVLTFILPASYATKTEYNLSTIQYKYLLFIVRVPIVALWLAAFYSYRWLARYAQRVHDTPEGPQYAGIARGMAWVAWGFPIPALLYALLTAVANSHADFLAFALIVTGYLYVVVPIVAFTYIGASSHALSQGAKVNLSYKHIRWLCLVFVSFSALFCVLIVSRLHGISWNDSFNPYYLPNWLVWLTLVIPYLYAAFLGIFAGLELMVIARRTAGIIYKQALQLLSGGVVLIILALELLQYFRSIVPRSGHLQIGTALFLTYFIYGIAAVGCLLLAAGAKRLKRIEDA